MSQVVARYRRRSAEVDALLTEAYVAGVSHRKAGTLTAALLGERVSRTTVRRVTKQLDSQVAALRRAPIEGEHPYLYLDATFLDARWHARWSMSRRWWPMRWARMGHRQLLGVTLGADESEAKGGQRRTHEQDLLLRPVHG